MKNYEVTLRMKKKKTTRKSNKNLCRGFWFYFSPEIPEKKRREKKRGTRKRGNKEGGRKN